MRTITVALLTFRRPDDLDALLPLLRQQVGRVPGSRVVVVDNDPDGSAASRLRGSGEPWLKVVHEPRPGIAAARNRALDEASGDDLLVFIDDDERPCEDWLQVLVSTFDRYGGGGVVGPVVSTFDGPLDPWITAGRFFERRRLRTGASVTVAATNNLLLDLRNVRGSRITFDERFGLSGGSDTLFTRQLVAAGHPLYWCDEAVVTDVVPAHRATRDWVLRRSLRSGNGWSRTTFALDPRPAARARAAVVLVTTGSLRLGGGAARWTLGVIGRRPAWRASGLRTAARGAGMISGAVGWTYVEYKRS